MSIWHLYFPTRRLLTIHSTGMWYHQCSTRVLMNFRLPQSWYWELRSSMVSRRGIGRVTSDVSKDRSAISAGSSSPSPTYSLTDWQWGWRQHDPSRSQELHSQRHSVIPQTTRNFRQIRTCHSTCRNTPEEYSIHWHHVPYFNKINWKHVS